MRIRHHSVSDLPAILALLDRCSADRYEYIPPTADALVRRLATEDLRILVADDGARLLGSAACHLGHWGEEIEWLVSTEGESCGDVRDRLVAELEGQARDSRVSVRLDAVPTVLAEWRARGYLVDGGIFHLVADLTGRTSPPSLSPRLSARSVEPRELDQVVEVVRSAYGWERLTVDQIESWKTQYPPFDERWILAIERAGRLVSIIVARPDGEYNDRHGARRGYLGPAATLPAHRRQGLAAFLAVRASDLLVAHGMRSAAAHVYETNTASLALTRTLGFEVRHHWVYVRKTLDPAPPAF